MKQVVATRLLMQVGRHQQPFGGRAARAWDDTPGRSRTSDETAPAPAAVRRMGEPLRGASGPRPRRGNPSL